MQHSVRHTLLFTTALCAVFSLLVSAVAVSLEERQSENRRLDRIRNVLVAAGLSRADEKLSREELAARFSENLEARVVELESGRFVSGIAALDYDQRRASRDPGRSRAVAPNLAKVRRVPQNGLVYLIKDGARTTGVVVPIEGYGLWSTLYGYLALSADARTVLGITFYEHGETPGLGGEVDNPKWKALWPGRRAFDARGDPVLRVAKGRAGPAASDPHRVDGLSGATITSNGVSNMLAFWLGPRGFGPFLARLRTASQGDL